MAVFRLSTPVDGRIDATLTVASSGPAVGVAWPVAVTFGKERYAFNGIDMAMAVVSQRGESAMAGTYVKAPNAGQKPMVLFALIDGKPMHCELIMDTGDGRVREAALAAFKVLCKRCGIPASIDYNQAFEDGHVTFDASLVAVSQTPRISGPALYLGAPR
jgi:hypothetical protein